MKYISIALLLVSMLAFTQDGFEYSKILIAIMACVLVFGAYIHYSDKNTGFVNPWVIFSLSFIQYYFIGPLDTFYFHDLMSLGTEIFGHIDPSDDAVLIPAITSSLLGLLAAILGYQLHMKKPGNKNESEREKVIFDMPRLRMMIIWTGLIGIASIAFFFSKVGFSIFTETGRGERYYMYAEAANYGFFMDFTSTAIVLASIYLIENNRFKPKITAALIFALFLPLIYFQMAIFSGSRITIIRPALVIALYWMIRTGRSRLNWRMVTFGVGLALFAILGGIFRTVMETPDALYATRVLLNGLTPELAYGYITQSFDYTTGYDIFLLLHNKYYDLAYGDTYLKLFYQIIPRELWPNKPENVTVMMSKIFRPEQMLLGTTYNPSLLGEMYYNFGLAGVLVGCFFFGKALAWLYQFGRRNVTNFPYLLIYSALVVSIIEHGRGAFSNILTQYFVFYIIPVLLVIKKIAPQEKYMIKN